MAEELPHPKRDLPIAIALQIGLGFLCRSRKILVCGSEIDLLQMRSVLLLPSHTLSLT